MVYKGNWTYDTTYSRGDIVSHRKRTYVCSRTHVSSLIMAPYQEDIYWIYIDPLEMTLLPNLLQINDTEGTINDETTQNDDFLNDSPPNDEEQMNDDIMITMEQSYEVFTQKRLKRKLEKLEADVREFESKKKRHMLSTNSLRERILLLDINLASKSVLLKKHDNLFTMTESDKHKTTTWLKTICDIPFGVLKPLQTGNADNITDNVEFFKNLQNTLDQAVYGHQDVKREISQFVAKMISNPNGKGQVLAICGDKGTGKTKLIKSGLAKALGLPFFQINFGGLSDSNVLTGHDLTYVGSKPGKLVDILSRAGCMNPIIYLDEIDKVSENKKREIFGILTHLLDPEQNHDFHDNYLAEVKLDLSKIFFVISFNHIEHVDTIARDRMKIIHVDSPTPQDRHFICKRFIIPELCAEVGFGFEGSSAFPDNLEITIDDELIKYILQFKIDKSPGLRQARHAFETLLNHINLQYILKDKSIANCIKDKSFAITKELVDRVLFEKPNQDLPPFYL